MTMSGFCLGISWNIYVTRHTKWQAVTQVSLPHTAVNHWVRFFPGCLGNFWSWNCQVPNSDSKYLCLQRLQKVSNPLGSLVSRSISCLASMFFWHSSFIGFIFLSISFFLCFRVFYFPLTDTVTTHKTMSEYMHINCSDLWINQWSWLYLSKKTIIYNNNIDNKINNLCSQFLNA